MPKRITKQATIPGRTPCVPLAALAFFMIAGLASCQRFEPARTRLTGPQARDGVLDLSSWDFEKRGPVTLSGEWLFLRGELVGGDGAAAEGWEKRPVPDIWKDGEGGLPGGRGAGTYRLDLILPPHAPELAIRSRTGITAFELEVDGRVIKAAGRPSLDPLKAVSAYDPGVSRVEAKGGKMRIFLRSSNHDYRNGGIWRPFQLGEARRLERERSFDFYASIACAVAMAAVAINYFVIFLFRKKERSFLYFALFGLAISIRPLVTGEYVLAQLFAAIPFDILVRIEYASAMLAAPAVLVLLASLFPGSIKKERVKLLALPYLPFLVALVLLPLYWLTKSIFAFYALTLAELSVGGGLILARAAKARAPGSRITLAAVIIMLLASANDLAYSSNLVSTFNSFPFALTAFIFLMSVVLAERFTLAFDRAEALSVELKDSNEALRSEVAECERTKRELEASLAQEEMLLREVHHRVKNSLQIVASLVGLQSHRSENPAVLEMAAMVRKRIRVISLVHERLYSLGARDSIELGGYARELVRLNTEGISPAEASPRIELEVEEMEVDSAFCIDLGLMLTELIANSLKYAIIPAGGGRLAVRIRRTGERLELSVEDDGPGFPGGFEPEKTRSLGYQVIISLAKRRKGKVGIGDGPGAKVVCSFPLDRRMREPEPRAGETPEALPERPAADTAARKA